MQLRDLMKIKPFTITEDWTLEEAAQKMLEIQTGILPVVEGSKYSPSKNPIGVLTDRDLVVRCMAKGKDPKTVKVIEGYTKDIVIAHPDDKVEESFNKMRRNAIGRLLVINENKELVGIVSLADIIANVPCDMWDRLQSNDAKWQPEKDVA
jgi:CBS domain-containing protein